LHTARQVKAGSFIKDIDSTIYNVDMESKYFERRNVIESEDDLIDFYLNVIDYRNKHKDDSATIAIEVFNKTHPANLLFPVSDSLKSIRFEFGALEAPGIPDADSEYSEMSLEDFDDMLWERLRKMIIANKKDSL